VARPRRRGDRMKRRQFITLLGGAGRPRGRSRRARSSQQATESLFAEKSRALFQQYRPI